MKYIVIGSSWASGEWEWDATLGKRLTHRGLQQWLIDQGHDVLDLSRAGTGNIDNARRLIFNIQRDDIKDVQAVICFFTDFIKDWHQANNTDTSMFSSIVDVGRYFAQQAYDLLQEAAEIADTKVILVGSDVDVIVTDLPSRVTVACQSFVNLCCNDQPEVEVPVLSMFDRSTIDLIRQLHKSTNSLQLADLLDHIDLGLARGKLLGQQQQWFWPDGIHANRQAHYKLLQFLQQNKYLD